MLEITNPLDTEMETVLRFAFQHLQPNEFAVRINALMQLYHIGKVDRSGVFQARHNNALVGAMYAQCRPDGSVMLWVPVMTEGFSPEPMLEVLTQFCRTKNAFAAVALADRNQTFDESVLCSVGEFRYLSDLIYLAVEIPSHLSSNAVSDYLPMHFAPFSEVLSKEGEDAEDRLTRLIKKTYHHSLDFPALMQIAPVEHVIKGYKTAEPFRPELWFLIQKNGKDIGALLLTDAPPDQMELTYMGLIESERKQGLAKKIVRFAQRMAAQEYRQILLTSVDDKNISACQSYLSQGFKAWNRQKVFARIFAMR